MIRKIQAAIRKYHLLEKGERVLIAVSGGADSVALLCMLHDAADQLGISLAVAHLNHCIRGKDSDADADFVRKLAKCLNVPFTGGRVDVPKMAKRTGLSMEMAAREARYSFLLKIARKFGANVIATAHTADDQAETVLLKLARGAGMRGLAGIPRELCVSGVRIIRPLLNVRRKDIETFLKERKQLWREDNTNRDLAYLRNHVRHEVLPFLEKKLNPDIRQTLIRTADILREEDELLEEISAEILKKCTAKHASTSSNDERMALSIAMLKKQCLATRRRVLRQWLSMSGVEPELINYDVVARIEALLGEETGTGEIEITGRQVVRKRYDRLTVEKKSNGLAKQFRCNVKIPGKTLVDNDRLKISTSMAPGLVRDKLVCVGQVPAMASVNLAAIGEKKLVVRSWRQGDRIKPFGMAGSKKLQDIFIDEKVPVEKRSRIPIFECDGEIIWVPGYRVARGWEVPNSSAPSLQICVEG